MRIGHRWGLAFVRGTSMEPTLRPGDRVFVSYRATPRPGRVVLARFSDGVLAVKRIEGPEKHHTGVTGWLLASDNPAAPGARRAPVPAAAVLGVVRARLWPRPGRIGRP